MCKLKVVAVCEYCEENIYENEDYWETDLIALHEDCMTDMSRKELAEMLGATRKYGDVCA